MKRKEGIRIERIKFIAGIFIGVFMSLLGYGQVHLRPQPGKIVVEIDPDIPNSFIVRLPEGFALVGEEGGQARMIAGPIAVTVECICKSGSEGCFLEVLGQETACLMTTCDLCEKKASGNFQGQDFVLNYPSILNLNKGVKIVERIEDIPPQPVSPIILQLDTVVNSIKKLYEGLKWIPDSILSQWMDHDPLTFGQIVIDVFGKWAVVPFPLGFIEHPYVALKPIGGGSNCTCSCKDGEGCKGECESQWIPGVGTIRYCDASHCRSCGLATQRLIEVNPEETAPEVEIKQIKEIAPDQYQIKVKITSKVSGHAVLRVFDFNLTNNSGWWQWQPLHTENITFTPNVPVEKTFNIAVNPNTGFLGFNISDGTGRIYFSKLISLP